MYARTHFFWAVFLFLLSVCTSAVYVFVYASMCVMARQLEKQQHYQRLVSVPISGHARHMHLKSQSESSTSALMAWCRRLWCSWGKTEKKFALLHLLENTEARHEVSNEYLALMNAIPTKRDLFELS